jgi:hypothetical protein
MVHNNYTNAIQETKGENTPTSPLPLFLVSNSPFTTDARFTRKKIFPQNLFATPDGEQTATTTKFVRFY